MGAEVIERKWSLRDSSGSYGRLVDQDEAIKAYNGIDPQRRPFVELTCWERVVDATAETIPPPDAPTASDPEGWGPDPFAARPTMTGKEVIETVRADPVLREAFDRLADERLAATEASIRAAMPTLTEEK